MIQRAKGVLLVALAILSAGSLTALIPPSSDPYPLNRIQTMPDKFRQGWANLITVESALHHYYVFEDRFPATFEELLKSDEMPVKPKDLINPYTGKPVKSVVTPSLGDIRYVYQPDALTGPDIHVEVFLDPAGDGSKVEALNWLGNFAAARNGMDARRNSLAGLDRYKGADRKMWFICEAIEGAAVRVHSRYDSTPRTFDDLVRQYGWWINPSMKNPYTGVPIREVSAPSAGDFTFAGLLDPRPGATGFAANFIICYDSSGNPLYTDPIVEHVIASYQELEQGNPPESRLLSNLPAGVSFKKKPG